MGREIRYFKTFQLPYKAMSQNFRKPKSCELAATCWAENYVWF